MCTHIVNSIIGINIPREEREFVFIDDGSGEMILMTCRHIRLDCSAKVCSGHSDKRHVISMIPPVTSDGGCTQIGIANRTSIPSNINMT